MPTILAIETSTELASVALLRAGKVTTRESRGAQTHSMTVLGLVQELITEAGITLSDCQYANRQMARVKYSYVCVISHP